MPYYAVVVANAQLAHDREIHRNIEHNVKAHGEQHRKRIERHIRQRYNHPPREAGTLHCHGERGCPDGEPWCEHCGDPAFVAQCTAAGHCEACVSLRHGAVAHPEVLKANGYELIEVPDTQIDAHPHDPWQRQIRSDHIWNPQTRTFQPKG